MVERVIIVRHGETEWSRSGRHTGRTDLPLSEQGESDARDLGRTLASLGIGGAFTSPLQRAMRTCKLSGLASGAQTDPDLAEWNYGDFEGLRTAEIIARWPQWRLFRDGCPGGESPRQVSERADRVIGRLRRLGGVVAVFSHGHFGRALAARWIGEEVALGERLLLDTASMGVSRSSTGMPRCLS